MYMQTYSHIIAIAVLKKRSGMAMILLPLKVIIVRRNKEE
jgi:hypothetical protein